MSKWDRDSTTQHPSDHGGVLAPPPRIVMVLSIGGLIALILGTFTGIFVFRNVLRPGQQQRVMNMLPFMESFLPLLPEEDVYVPTAASDPNNAISPEDLLNMTFSTPTSSAETLTPKATETSMQTPTIMPSSTALPSITPLASAPPVVPTATTLPAALIPSSARIYGLRSVFQTWNNCGPATITMGLSYFGWTEDQVFAASFLKPDEEDKNVTPGEMVQFVNEQTGVRALTRMGGTLDLLKAFIASGFPVIVSIGYAPEGEDWLGHYRALVGYDDVQQRFYAYDSYLGVGENGQGIIVPYAELDSAWQHFNRNFIVLYQPQVEAQIAEILGERSDLRRAAELALEVAQREAQNDPRNGFAWFNMGTASIALGQYEEAAVAYDRARQSNLPWRMMWYQFGPYEAYFSVGRYDDVIALVNTNLVNGGTYVEETYFWQGQVFAARGDTANAQTAFNRALQANSRYTDAQVALNDLITGS